MVRPNERGGELLDLQWDTPALLSCLIREMGRHYWLVGRNKKIEFQQLATRLADVVRERLPPNPAWVGTLAEPSWSIEMKGWPMPGRELVEVEAALLLVAKPVSPLEALAVVLDEVRIRLDSPDRPERSV